MQIVSNFLIVGDRKTIAASFADIVAVGVPTPKRMSMNASDLNLFARVPCKGAHSIEHRSRVIRRTDHEQVGAFRDGAEQDSGFPWVQNVSLSRSARIVIDFAARMALPSMANVEDQNDAD